MKYWKKPTNDLVERAIALLPSHQKYKYFFEKLENPEWIKPLWEKGFFKKPPGPQENINDGSMILPYWPESRYLARMAKIKPDDVLEVILAIPDSQNPQVYSDVIDAALNMPPNKAVKLIDKAKRATSEPFLWFSERFGELLRHLINGGEIDAAMELAEVLLEVFPDPEEKEIRSSDNIFPLRLEPRTHFNSLTGYEKILKVDFIRIIEKKGLPTLELLCHLLEKTIHLSKRHITEGADEDFSSAWRPAIEDHEQNHPRKLDDIIVEAVRDGFEYLAKNDNSKVQELIQILESRRPKIFRRIALHLMREFSDCVPQLITERLTNRVLFDDIDAWHEYALLLKNCFGMLSTDNQQLIFGWIMEQTNGAEKEPLEKWQLNRLSLIEAFLPPPLKQRYGELLKAHGQPQHPEFNFYHSINSEWGGPSAAIEKDKLISMPVSDIAKFLKEWQPVDQGIFGPSPAGQGKELESVIGQEPGKFVNELSEFEGVEPTYARHLISGFCDALKQNKRFPWPNVLKFCLWMVNQQRDAVRLTPGMSNIVYHLYIGDPDWTGARQSVVKLLSAGLDEKADNGICIDQRKFVWTIIVPLTEDPDPIPENDMNEISSWSIRVNAIDVVIRYALWIRRHNGDLQEKGFDVMPEVREVLNEHLDASKEPSLSVRSIYGQWFPQLVSLDKGWATEKASMIFPLEEPQRKFFHAAWDDYIIYCAPYDGVFEILREQYALAVDLLASKTGIEDADKDLARHLMVFYYRGKLELTDPQGLFSQFWLKALPGLRAIALEFIGRSLKQIEEEISSGIIDRLKRLWLQRLETGRNSDQPDNYNSEMAAFTWWINSGKFETAWALDRLKDALEIATETNNFFWPEVLSESISLSPIETMQCLKMLVEKDRTGWQIHGWNDELREVLNKALTTEASQEAKNLINDLGSRGYLKFRDLLKGF